LLTDAVAPTAAADHWEAVPSEIASGPGGGAAAMNAAGIVQRKGIMSETLRVGGKRKLVDRRIRLLLLASKAQRDGDRNLEIRAIP
jgi:hypothetical protein